MDWSIELYNRINSLTTKKLEVKLVSGEVFQGFITGLFRDSEGFGENGIIGWHLVEQQEKDWYDSFGIRNGIFFLTKDIVYVKLLQNDLIIKFE